MMELKLYKTKKKKKEACHSAGKVVATAFRNTEDVVLTNFIIYLNTIISLIPVYI